MDDDVDIFERYLDSGRKAEKAAAQFAWERAVLAAIIAHKRNRTKGARAGLTAGDLMVAVALCRWADDGDLSFFRSQADLARDVGMTETGARGCVDRLLAAGFLAEAPPKARTKRPGRLARTYRLTVPKCFPSGGCGNSDKVSATAAGETTPGFPQPEQRKLGGRAAGQFPQQRLPSFRNSGCDHSKEESREKAPQLQRRLPLLSVVSSGALRARRNQTDADAAAADDGPFDRRWQS